MKITESALKLLLKEEMKKVLLEKGVPGKITKAAHRKEQPDDLAVQTVAPAAQPQPTAVQTVAQPQPTAVQTVAPAPQQKKPVVKKPVRNDEAAVAAAKNVQFSNDRTIISWQDNAWNYKVNFYKNFISAGKIGEEMKPVQNAGATQQAWQAIWSVAGMLKARNPAPQLQSGMHNAVSRITNPNAQFISNASTALKGLNK